MRTITEIAATIDVVALPEYRRELVYVDYRDDFHPDTVEQLLRGHWPTHVDEWINDSQWSSACDLAEALFKEACEDDEFEEHETTWLASPDRDDLIQLLCENDTSNPYRDLMRNTGQMLFRYAPPEDDMCWVGEGDTAETLHAELGLADDLLPAVQAIWPEIEGYTVSGGGFLASFVFSANPADLWEIPSDGTIEVTDPFLWLCNPWAGNGYGEVAAGVTVTLNMADVHTDRGAWGYSADETFGGLCLPDSTVTEAMKAEH